MRHPKKKLGLGLLCLFISLGTPMVLLGTQTILPNISTHQVAAVTAADSSSDAVFVPDDSATEPKTDDAPALTPEIEPSAEPFETLPSDPESFPSTRASDSAPTPTPAGFNILGFPLRYGFTSQPTSIQYAKKGKDVLLHATATGMNLLTSVKFYVTRWSLNSNNEWKAYFDSNYYPAQSIGLNQHAVDVAYGPSGRAALPVGVHYFQIQVTYGYSTYYSQLAKVVVSPNDINTKDLTVFPENTAVFANISYEATANITPEAATSPVNWRTITGLTFDPSIGRRTKFTPDSGLITKRVNRDTEHPGFPINLTANAENTDSTISNTAQIYVGGLKAQDLPIAQAKKQGLTWPIYGLEKIQKEFFSPEYEAVKSATYQWTCYRVGSNGVYAATPWPSDILNTSGNFNNGVETLNQDQKLTIPGNSPFIIAAASATKAGRPFYVQLNLTLTLNDNKSITIPTNKAQLSIQPGTGALTLTQVPSFNFSNVPSSQIYQGNTTLDSSNKPKSDNLDNSTLAVSDTRTDGDNWTLQAKLAPFTDQHQQGLNSVHLNLMGIPNAPVIDLPDQDQWLTIATSSQNKTGVFPMRSTLTLAANPEVNLFDEQIFGSTITWNLSTTDLQVPQL
ncbi:WxL domain-containing protein [Agrilactobacillus yilanensis]|uniref:WxL domain-containing protein n=1 Tax=Agrilactobacillus yilanensis TaxID=2485997 RepID=A0ABW4J519_9LACO|nr:WxL domain-containing protein [Agrilactobacillus yilanensis]